MITEKNKNSVDNNTDDDDEENDIHANLGIMTRSSSPTPHRSKTNSVISKSSKVNNRARSASNVSKRKRQRLN
jgi:hypothetical protein